MPCLVHCWFRAELLGYLRQTTLVDGRAGELVGARLAGVCLIARDTLIGRCLREVAHGGSALLDWLVLLTNNFLIEEVASLYEGTGEAVGLAPI